MAKTIRLQLDNVPPPAGRPGAARESPPLPIGRPVIVGQTGAQTAVPPIGMAAAVDEAVRHAQNSVEVAANTPPVDPATPPVEFKVVDESGVPPQKRAEVRDLIAEARRANVSEPARKIAATPQIDMRDAPPPDRPATRASPDPNYRRPASAPAAEPAAPAAAPAAASAAEAAAVRFCPHCQWDLSAPGQPEPTHSERTTFLQALLGDKVYARSYRLFGGGLQITFRTLTTQEIDAVFKQAFRERDRGEFTSAADMYERVNRLRLYLQLQRVTSPEYDHDMPDGLTKETSPNATAYWDAPPGAEVLKLVEKHILEGVLRSESVWRVAMQQCSKFNQLVSRMEILMDSDSFWKATGQPSAS